MCFYYAVTHKNPHALVGKGIVKEEQLSLFDERHIVSGFDHPSMPLITSAEPDKISFFRWGMLPQSISSDEQAKAFLNKYNTLNAKADEVFESRLYADAVLHRRCLVLCSGFFEWRMVKKEKIPYYISLKNDEMFVFAGIWSESVDKTGKKHQTFSVLTTEANEMMAEIHNTKKRMPVILTPDSAEQWLKPDLPVDEIRKLLIPLPSEQMKAHTIQKFIPSKANELNNPNIIAYYSYSAMNDLFTSNNSLFR